MLPELLGCKGRLDLAATTKRYFRFLGTIGHELSDVEQLVLSKLAPAARPILPLP